MLMKPLTMKEAEILINKGAIKKGSGLIIRGLSKDEFDEYILYKIVKYEDCFGFFVYKHFKDCCFKVKQSAIVKVDEMDVHRLLESYSGIDDVYEVDKETDVGKTIIGKTEATLWGEPLKNGMKILLMNIAQEGRTTRNFVLRLVVWQ